MRPANLAAPRWAWGRHLLVGILLLLLAGLGLFEEAVFTGLGHLWHPGRAPTALPGFTTHGLPVAISYRLLYALLNLMLVHLVLRGRFTRIVASGYAVGYAASAALLLLAKFACLPFAAITAHRVLDVLSSPLPIMLAYPLVVLMRAVPTTQESGSKNMVTTPAAQKNEVVSAAAV